MQTSLLVTLVFCVLLSVQGYYFGFIRPPKALAYLQKATFVFMTFFMIPFLVIVLWKQNGAETRLAGTGFVPHPSINKCVGITMDMGDPPTWIFTVDASADDILAFYSQVEHRPGWELISGNKQMMVFMNGSMEMNVLFHSGRQENTIAFILQAEDEQ